MIFLKTDDEIELLRQSNLLVGRTLAEVAKMIQPGVTTKQLDKVAEEFIRDHGAIPTFKGFPNPYGSPFPGTLCTSVNDQVVHGIPNDIPLKDGDIVSVDCGTFMNGFCGDSAYTFCVGEVDPEIVKLLKVTKESLYKGIENAVHGKRLGDIGYSIQEYCEAHSYGVVREFVGHDGEIFCLFSAHSSPSHRSSGGASAIFTHDPVPPVTAVTVQSADILRRTAEVLYVFPYRQPFLRPAPGYGLHAESY